MTTDGHGVKSGVAVEPSPAATVVVLRERRAALEVLMVRRHDRTAFLAGASVFPGGRVDPADATTTSGDEDSADRVAAIRELFEETGILLARDRAERFLSFADEHVRERFARHRRDVHAGSRGFIEILDAEGLRPALDALVPCARWVTPPIDVRRFDTRFFLSSAPAEQSPAHDDAETTECLWTTPSEALERCRRREIYLPPPTWTTLRELERFASSADALTWARRRRIVAREPRLVIENGRNLLVLPGDRLNADPWPEPPPRETRFEIIDGRWLPDGW